VTAAGCAREPVTFGDVRVNPLAKSCCTAAKACVRGLPRRVGASAPVCRFPAEISSISGASPLRFDRAVLAA
jgi:hypothetical protein